MTDNTDAAETARTLRSLTTQFNTLKTADQQVVWNVDASRDFSRQRQIWYSNGTIFDMGLFTDAPNEAVITLAAADDEARYKSAYVGRYISHALSEPGLSFSIDGANLVFDSANEISLDHGLVQFGPFFHDGTDITDGFGIEIDTNGARFRAVAGGVDMGNTPVPQGEWNLNRAHSPDNRLDYAIQTVYNFAYGYYNALPVSYQRVKPADKQDNRAVSQETLHAENPTTAPVLNTPNLPMQVYASNEGTAEPLTVSVGGMQYARYGSADPNERTTTEWRETTGSTFTAATSGTPDPEAAPGDPIFAYQREADSFDLVMGDKEVIIDPTAALYVFFWDEWDPATALDGAFDNPTGTATDGDADKESNILVNNTCTSYTPTTYNFRGMRPVDSGKNNEFDPSSETVDDRVPQEATRVITALASDGSNSFDLNYLEYEIAEGY